MVEIEQILIGNQQTFFFGKWAAWTAVSPLFLISDMMMSFGDHGRAPRNLLGGIAFDAMTISYSVVFNGKDAFPSCVTSTSGNTIFGGLDKKSFIILYISNVEKISRNYLDTLFRYPHSYYLPLLGLDNMHTTVKIKIDFTRHNTMVCSF